MTARTDDKAAAASEIFASTAPLAEAWGAVALPLHSREKTPLLKQWQKAHELTPEQRLGWQTSHPQANVGLLLGTPLPIGQKLVAIDVDVDVWVPFICEVLQSDEGKVGQKGITIFARADAAVKARKLKTEGATKPFVEILADGNQTVIPPSMRPAGMPYRWTRASLFDRAHEDLPQLTTKRLAVIEAVVTNRYANEIVEGGSSVHGHDLMLKLTSSGIANLVEDPVRLAACLNRLFHPDYDGDTKDETLAMLESARAKELGKSNWSTGDYDPGEEGPVPLGYTKEGSFALLDRQRQIIVMASPHQLMSMQFLIGIASPAFWSKKFPTKKGTNWILAGTMLIAACRAKGPFMPERVRGRGVWLEGGRVVVNLGEKVESQKHLYLCFEPLNIEGHSEFDARRLLGLLRSFAWRDPQDAMLLLGWLAIAPICGVLNWRPHMFLYGPARSGKTTLQTLASALLTPLAITADGQSSEAGIRQTLGPDSLPILLDEFESDHRASNLAQIIRLARSASSAENTVLRGTPEGKAMTFSLRTTFLFAAINPRGMAPADRSRIIMAELLMHANDRDQARRIREEVVHFRTLGSAWSSHMIKHAELIGPAIDTVEPKIGASDHRHRLNVATLLAGSFVALCGRAPTSQEAEALAEEYQASIDRHAEDIERDDAQECLDHLFAYQVDTTTLGHCIAEARHRHGRRQNIPSDSMKILATHDLIVKLDEPYLGLLVRNGSPAIDRVFDGTRWGQGAWTKALRKLNGAFYPDHPVQFSGSGKKSRCVGIPLEYLPEKQPGDPTDIY